MFLCDSSGPQAAHGMFQGAPASHRLEVLRRGLRQLADLLVPSPASFRPQHVTEPEYGNRRQFLHESSLWRMEEIAALVAVAAAAPPMTPAPTLLRRRKPPVAAIVAMVPSIRSHLLLRLKSLICFVSFCIPLFPPELTCPDSYVC